MEENRLTYRISEVVGITGLSRSTIYRLIAQNELPLIKVCGRSLIAKADLEAMIDRMRVGAPRPADKP